jgi:hypothetical protein
MSRHMIRAAIFILQRRKRITNECAEKEVAEATGAVDKEPPLKKKAG